MLRRRLFLLSAVLIALLFAGAQPSLAANNAAFLSQDVPTTMTTGQTRQVSITMMNTGTTTWTPGVWGYKLGTQSPQHNTLWTGGTRIWLAPGDSIVPGQPKTFTFTIQAPASPGLYIFQWRMLLEGVEWFGDFTPAVLIDVTASAQDNAQFISQIVPSSISAGQTRSVSVTMKNTGSSTWTRAAGIKLGSENPRDNVTWGLNRVLLPVQPIAPGQQVTFTFNVTAPSFADDHDFQWRMLREGVAWFGQYSSNVKLPVTQAVTVCPGIQAVLNDRINDREALQGCIDSTPDGGTLEIPRGVYDLGTSNPDETGPLLYIHIERPMTLRTSGTAGSTQSCAAIRCAILRARPGFNSNIGGVLLVQNASGVTIDHIDFDGNREDRQDTVAKGKCASGAAGSNRWGFNIRITSCSTCRFTYNVSRNALCGTGLEFAGHGATITNNVFRDNGKNSEMYMWADGLTVIYSDGSTITNNTLIDNSDVDLVVGGGRSALVANNSISHSRQLAFAGLVMFNFENLSAGDFTGALFTQNRIDCGAGRNCHFGIVAGPHTWDPTLQTFGGTIQGNTVINALQGINVDGAGTAASPLTLYNNSVSGTPASGTFLCGTRATSPLNIYTPHSVVNRNGDATPATNRLWHSCP